jgi:hypothetical protein
MPCPMRPSSTRSKFMAWGRLATGRRMVIVAPARMISDHHEKALHVQNEDALRRQTPLTSNNRTLDNARAGDRRPHVASHNRKVTLCAPHRAGRVRQVRARWRFLPIGTRAPILSVPAVCSGRGERAALSGVTVSRGALPFMAQPADFGLPGKPRHQFFARAHSARAAYSEMQNDNTPP